MHADFAGARSHHLATRFHEVVDIDQLAADTVVDFLAQRIDTQEKLHAPAFVFNMGEGQLALGVQAADASNQRDFQRLLSVFAVFKCGDRLGDAMAAPCPRGIERDASICQSLGFVQPLQFQFVGLPHAGKSSRECGNAAQTIVQDGRKLQMESPMRGLRKLALAFVRQPPMLVQAFAYLWIALLYARR